ncbi:TPA: hypothetical protein SJG61_002093 [Staphylococcus aureus]|nr:hypothetical protein [Staphylococcus aureus]HDA2620725.1 hypothetical protein [Staphylococcus aureus]HEI6646963.1 hypothetical protein [Staphylococcus aureus]
MIQKARKKPVEIEFIKYTGDNQQEIYDWSNGKACDVINRLDGSTYFGVNTLEGFLIVKGVEGEFYPVDPNIFKKTYEVID